METYFKAVMSKRFVHFLQNIPQDTIHNWQDKYLKRGEIRPNEVECIIKSSTATAQVRTSCIIRISSSTYIWR